MMSLDVGMCICMTCLEFLDVVIFIGIKEIKHVETRFVKESSYFFVNIMERIIVKRELKIGKNDYDNFEIVMFHDFSQMQNGFFKFLEADISFLVKIFLAGNPFFCDACVFDDA